MKKYNIRNYIQYKKDVKAAIARLEGKMWDEYTREELIIKFLPLVENMARKFSTSQQASGVMSVMDMIQSGNLGLVHAVRKLDYDKLKESEDMEKTLKSKKDRQKVHLAFSLKLAFSGYLFFMWTDLRNRLNTLKAR